MEKVDQYRLEDVDVYAIEGDLDHSTAPLLKSAASGSLAGHGRVLIDLQLCSYVDSGGLGLLLALVSGLTAEGWLGVIGPNRNVRRLFELAGLADHPAFHVFAATQDAVQFIRSQPTRRAAEPG